MMSCRALMTIETVVIDRKWNKYFDNIYTDEFSNYCIALFNWRTLKSGQHIPQLFHAIHVTCHSLPLTFLRNEGGTTHRPVLLGQQMGSNVRSCQFVVKCGKTLLCNG